VNTAAQTLRGEYADRQPAEVNKMIEILKNALVPWSKSEVSSRKRIWQELIRLDNLR
jgi:hypothetical protein